MQSKEGGGNMQKTMILIFCWLILIGMGCEDESARVQNENPENELPVIIHLEKRNEIVTITSGHDGLLYSVRNKDGRMLGQNLSEQELRAKLPDIYHSLKKSYAECNKRSEIWGGD
jgi:hypothetical protein